jgi:hypothetical protein
MVPPVSAASPLPVSAAEALLPVSAGAALLPPLLLHAAIVKTIAMQSATTKIFLIFLLLIVFNSFNNFAAVYLLN